MRTSVRKRPTESAGAPDMAASARATLQPPAMIGNSPRLPSFEFSTRGLARPEQFMAWRECFEPLLDLSISGDANDGFVGEQVLWDLGSLAFMRVRTDALKFASLAGNARRDPVDHWMMTVILRGSSITVTPERTFHGDAGVLQVHPLCRSFSGQVTDSDMLVLFVPRDLCRAMAHALDATENALLDTGLGRLLADYTIDLDRRLPMLDSKDLPGLVEATRAMIFACVAPSAARMEEAKDSITVALLERARQCVQANLFSPELESDFLCRELGISRSRLYRLFEASGGVMRYIQRRRLLDAHAALSDPNDHRRILEIAEVRGFGDGAEFSRAFKREFGYSPSDVRGGGKAGMYRRPDFDLHAGKAGDRLGMLLRRLQI